MIYMIQKLVSVTTMNDNDEQDVGMGVDELDIEEEMGGIEENDQEEEINNFIQIEPHFGKSRGRPRDIKRKHDVLYLHGE